MGIRLLSECQIAAPSEHRYCFEVILEWQLTKTSITTETSSVLVPGTREFALVQLKKDYPL